MIEVQNLQQALAALAEITSRPQVNPGPITGEVNDQTVSAVIDSMDLLTDHLSFWQKTIIKAGLLLGAASGEAKKVVTDYANELAAAATAAALGYKLTDSKPTISQIITNHPGTSIAVILALGFIGYRIYYNKSKS